MFFLSLSPHPSKAPPLPRLPLPGDFPGLGSLGPVNLAESSFPVNLPLIQLEAAHFTSVE